MDTNAESWNGKAVSIECDAKLGIFQGIIRGISEDQITIARAFRNGVPLRKQNAEVTLRSQDIIDIKLLPDYNGQSTLLSAVINEPTPVQQPSFAKFIESVEIATALASPKFDAKKHQQAREEILKRMQEQQHREISEAMARCIAARNTSSSLLTTKMQSMQMHDSSPTSSTNSSQKCSPPLGVSADGSTTDTTEKITVTPNQNVAQFFGFLIPPKVEVRMGAAINPHLAAGSKKFQQPKFESSNSLNKSTSKPIDMPLIVYNDTSADNYGNGYGNGYKQRYVKSLNAALGIGNGNGNGNGHSYGNGNGNGHSYGNGNGNGLTLGKKQRNKLMRRENNTRRNLAFGNTADDPVSNGDFDFESNLALFDKRAIWNVIEAEERRAGGVGEPRQFTPQNNKQELKYRHDENILTSAPLELKQIESVFDGDSKFVTDEGLIIPTIPIFVRTKIEMHAVRSGFTLQRQIDILARGAADLTLSLLGGARRFTPNNQHQWPKIVIICEESENYRTSNIGAATGRTLASHGVSVRLYLEEHPNIETKNPEIALYQATGNVVTYSVEALYKPDLVILVTNKPNISDTVKKWLNDTRASVFAIDPPPSGVNDILIKYSILPILPLNGISVNNCGKLFLCNVGLPNKYFNECGIKYKSPFGHKYVIPIHLKD